MPVFHISCTSALHPCASPACLLHQQLVFLRSAHELKLKAFRGTLVLPSYHSMPNHLSGSCAIRSDEDVDDERRGGLRRRAFSIRVWSVHVCQIHVDVGTWREDIAACSSCSHSSAAHFVWSCIRAPTPRRSHRRGLFGVRFSGERSRQSLSLPSVSAMSLQAHPLVRLEFFLCEVASHPSSSAGRHSRSDGQALPVQEAVKGALLCFSAYFATMYMFMSPVSQVLSFFSFHNFHRFVHCFGFRWRWHKSDFCTVL